MSTQITTYYEIVSQLPEDASVTFLDVSNAKRAATNRDARPNATRWRVERAAGFRRVAAVSSVSVCVIAFHLLCKRTRQRSKLLRQPRSRT